jgi:erythromycin esterase
MRTIAARLLGLALLGALAASAQSEPLQQWIGAHAVPVRSLDPMDTDFSDLEPLISAIGSARVVQLGEPSHGAGSAFAAKVRLIKFLHQRMGFDVIAWESNLHALTLAQAGMRGGEGAVTAAQRGVFAIWSGAAEAKPLFEYVRDSQATTRPLEMAGFDMQITAQNSAERFAAELRAFTHALADPTEATRASTLAEQVIDAYARLYARIEARARNTKDWESLPRPAPEVLEDLERSAGGLLAEIRKERASFARVHSTATIALMEHSIANLRADGANVFARQRADRPTGAAQTPLRTEEWTRRDTLMAHNLRWLIEEQFRGRKVIVWAHNAHLMNAHFSADWQSVHQRARQGGMTPYGAIIAKWLGDAVYTIALTTYEGTDGWATTSKTTAIAPAPVGSIEERLHRLEIPVVFLDLRSARRASGHPLHSPISMRVSGYGQPTAQNGNDTLPDLTRAFDAILYIDRMSPATGIAN